jgi:hypothetical protein
MAISPINSRQALSELQQDPQLDWRVRGGKMWVPGLEPSTAGQFAGFKPWASGRIALPEKPLRSSGCCDPNRPEIG